MEIDASSPPAVTGNPTATTASFLPPDDSILVVTFAGNDAGATLNQPTITDSLATDLTYTRHEWWSRHDTGLFGQVAVWTAPVGVGTSMTVSVTNNDGAGARQCAVKVYVITGQDFAVWVGVHAGGSSDSTNAVAASYTASADNSQGFLVFSDWDCAGIGTAGSGTTMDGSAIIPTNQLGYGFAHRTLADGAIGGTTELNVNLPGTTTNIHWAYVEILDLFGDIPEVDPPPYALFRPPGEGIAPNGLRISWEGTANAAPDDTGLRIHESSPLVAVNAVGTVSGCTTLSFTPPAGSLLLVLWVGNSVDNTNPITPTITDSLGSPLTYTLTDWQSRASAPTVDGQAAAWTAPVITSAPMTVTVNNNAASGTRHGAVQVLVLINEHASTPVGVHGKTGSTSANQIAQLYTASATGGQGFIAVADWTNTGAAKPGMGNVLAREGSAGVVPGQLSFGFFRRTSPDDVSAVDNRLNVQLLGTATDLSWVYVEILPTGGGGPQIEAQDGTGSLGLSGSGSAVKVAIQTGQCSIGFSGIATASKVTGQVSNATMGLTGRATAVKVAPRTGVVSIGLTGRAAVAKVALGIGRSVIGFAPYGPTQASREQTGRSALGLSGRATAVHVAAGVARSVVGLSARATATKRSVSNGLVAIGMVGSGVEVKRATPVSRAQMGLQGSATVVKRATPAALSALAWAGIGTARKVVAETGNGYLGFVPFGPTQGAQPRAQTGRCAIGLSGRAIAVHAGSPTARCVIGLSGRGIVVKRVGYTSSGALGLSGRASVVKRAMPLATGSIGLSARGSAGHFASRSGVCTIGLSGRSANGKRITVSARSAMGLTGFGPFSGAGVIIRVGRDGGPIVLALLTRDVSLYPADATTLDVLTRISSLYVETPAISLVNERGIIRLQESQ